MIAAATIHAPYLTAWPERAPEEHQRATLDGFAAMRQAFEAAGTDTLVVVTSEHIVNLEPRLAAPFIIGVGADHPVFPERHFNLPVDTYRGDAPLATALVEGLYRDGFEPAHSTELTLDHGTVLPLHLLGLGSSVAVVPIVVNSIFPPLPTLARCRALGEALARLLAAEGRGRRIGLLATGGISHTVGAPGVQENDLAFDERFLAAIDEGDLDCVCAITDADMDAAGNGTHEVRNWVVVAAAMQPHRPRPLSRIAFAPGWNTGVHQLLWGPA